MGPGARVALVGVGVLLLPACGEHEFHPPDREAQVAAADTAFAALRFDTLTWVSDSARITEGNETWAATCSRCHGPLGRGDTEYAHEQEIEVPSLVEPDWPYAGDMQAVRRRVFTGHPEGMPSLGVGRLSAREVDAVAHYVLEQLRPEVLGTGGG